MGKNKGIHKKDIKLIIFFRSYSRIRESTFLWSGPVGIRSYWYKEYQEERRDVTGAKEELRDPRKNLPNFNKGEKCKTFLLQNPFKTF